MAGKGDKRRPMNISQDTYNANWERAFTTPKETNGSPTDKPAGDPQEPEVLRDNRPVRLRSAAEDGSL